MIRTAGDVMNAEPEGGCEATEARQGSRP